MRRRQCEIANLQGISRMGGSNPKKSVAEREALARYLEQRNRSGGLETVKAMGGVAGGEMKPCFFRGG